MFILKIYLEIAVPTILGGMDLNTNMELIPGLHQDVTTEEGYVYNYAFEKIATLDRIHFIHPIKLSQIDKTETGTKYCKLIIEVTIKMKHLD